MKILVTGITGHSGTWFLKELEKNYFDGQIHVLLRESSNQELLNQSNINIIKHFGDLKDINSLIEATKGIDIIVHIAGIRDSLNVLDAAIKNEVNWFIGVHTTGIYSKYKIASEEYKDIEKQIDHYRSKINITLLRPTMIYGSSKDRNMYKLVKFLYKSPIFPIFGNGRNLMQPVHARDLGEAYFKVMMNPEITMNQDYNLSGKQPLTYKNLVKIVASKLNKKILIIHIPVKVSYYLVSLLQILPFFPINSEQVLRMQEDKDFSYEKAKKDFGYNPVSFEEGIVNEIQEYINSKR